MWDRAMFGTHFVLSSLLSYQFITQKARPEFDTFTHTRQVYVISSGRSKNTFEATRQRQKFLVSHRNLEWMKRHELDGMNAAHIDGKYFSDDKWASIGSASD